MSIVPAESYLDVTTSNFSRYVNLTYPDDDWHQDFQYHGRNVYAYFLAKWESSIDLISIQLYESWAHADYNTTVLMQPPADYLYSYVHQFLSTYPGGPAGYYVDFAQDPEFADMGRVFVPIPLHKLMIGFGNGWVLDNGGKSVWVTTQGEQFRFRPSPEFLSVSNGPLSIYLTQ